MEHFTFSWQTIDGLAIYAQGWRPLGDVRAVLAVVHGLGEHGGRYLKIAQPLVSQGYGVITFDQRGFGRSQGRRGHTPGYDSLLADIDCLLEQAACFFPGKPRFLYGHSLGGNLVLNFGLRRERGLAGIIATSPWLRLAFPLPRWKILLARIMDRIWPTYTQSHGLRPAAQTAGGVPDLVQDPLVHDRISARLFTRVQEAGIWALANASRWQTPLLLMHGEEDDITSPAASQEFARKVGALCTFKLWPGLGHELYQEHAKAQVLEFLLQWLAKKLTEKNVK